MTVASETNRSGPYNGNGVTTIFNYGFRIVNENHIRVIHADADGVETTLVIDTDYIVSDVGDPLGGQIALTVAPATGTTITVLREVPFTQETDLENQGAFYAETIEDALDLAVMRDQQLAEKLNRAILIPASEPDPAGELASALAADITRLAASADQIDTVSTSIADVETVATSIADIGTVATHIDAVIAASGSVLSLMHGEFTGDGTDVTFTLPGEPVSAENVLVWLDGVRQVPGADYTVSGVTLTFLTAPAIGAAVEVLVITAVSMQDVEALKDAAEAAAAAAEAAAVSASNLFATVADLTASTLPFAEGDLLTVRASGMNYMVAASGASDHHETTAGGVKLYEAGPIFSTRARLGAAVTRGDLPDGANVTADGFDYTIDSTATGLLSALNGIGVDGVRGHGPLNFYVFPGFKTQDNTYQHLHVSADGRRFRRLNRLEMLRGGADAAVGGRDAQLFWVEELKEWWMPVTAGDAQPYDFSVYRSPDLLTWRITNCYLNGTGVRNTMLPGAVTNAPQLWSPRFFRDTDGTISVIISIRTGPNYTNHLGDTASPCFRPWKAPCTNLTTMTFGMPVHMGIGALSDPKLDPDFIRNGSTWYTCIKDSANRNIEIWSASSLAGPWTEGVTLDLDGTYDSLEGPTWAPQRYYDAGTGALGVKWRVHVANNRDAADALKGVPWFFESTTSPAGPYGSATQLDFSHATRNGTITNVALDGDPRAMETLKTAVAAWGGQDREAYDEIVLLANGSQDLYPQQDFLYYVEGTGNVATLTFRQKVADRFWLASLSLYSDTGINVVGNGFARAQAVGFASPVFHIVEMRWCSQTASYLPVGQDTKKRFKATKSGTQAVNGTATVTWETEVWDVGAAFASNGWTPGRGLVELRAQVTFSNAVAGEIYRISIQKNGSDFVTARAHGGVGGAISVMVMATDQPLSNDVYTVAVTTTASRTITDTVTSTWFEGRQL